MSILGVVVFLGRGKLLMMEVGGKEAPLVLFTHSIHHEIGRERSDWEKGGLDAWRALNNAPLYHGIGIGVRGYDSGMYSLHVHFNKDASSGAVVLASEAVEHKP